MALSPSSKAGQFYLGGPHTLKKAKLGDDPLYYSSKDLVTHGVCIGMTGSGKTGLCMALLEECALSGIPAIIIDPKGDLTNLELVFPELRPADFLPWVNEDEARRKGITPEAFAEDEAKNWKDGLAGWGINAEQMRALRERVDVRIFTPGSTAGTPLSILKSFDPPASAILEDDELRREQIAGAVSALLGLVDNTDDSVQGREHILLSTILEKRWLAHESTDLTTLIRLIQTPPFETLGALALESFFPDKERMKLAMDLNTLLAAPSFQNWLTGEPLAIETLLKAPDGRPRLSICYIAHLSDAERMFFVSLLLNNTVAWMRSQSGTAGLRALLYFDEIFSYLPPHPKDPPSKRLLMTLLKQGRAFGLGTMLVTQNPVDLDYKALSNCGTWLIGRLQTEQDKARILDGLQGAMDQAGNATDRGDLDEILTRLGKRVFLLHNVHSGKPEVFHSRWAMSYLAGPLTRQQLKKLTDAEGRAATPTTTTPQKESASLNDFISDETNLSSVAPAAPSGLTVRYLPQNAPSEFTPSIFARADILFKDARSGETASRTWLLRLPPHTEPLDWDHAEILPADTLLTDKAPHGARFEPLPPLYQDIAALKKLGASLENHLIKIGGMETFVCEGLKEKSRFDESRADFEKRLAQVASIIADNESLKLRNIVSKKRDALQTHLNKEQDDLRFDEEHATTRKTQEAVSFLSSVADTLLSVLGGRRSTGIRKVGTALKSASHKRGMTQRATQEVERTRENIAHLESEIAELDAQLNRDIQTLRARIDADRQNIQSSKLIPTKPNIEIQEFGILWMAQ